MWQMLLSRAMTPSRPFAALVRGAPLPAVCGGVEVAMGSGRFETRLAPETRAVAEARRKKRGGYYPINPPDGAVSGRIACESAGAAGPSGVARRTVPGGGPAVRPRRIAGPRPVW